MSQSISHLIYLNHLK